ncbi:MAG: hypothetical protein INH41_10350 [Myxococcaceae bacterium]|jgi:hypothetical protein|nr:hypothetical protein [Myxococcaceae bacterium]
MPVATVHTAMQAHADTYKAEVTAMTQMASCLGGAQSNTVDWSRACADRHGTAGFGDEG